MSSRVCYTTPAFFAESRMRHRPDKYGGQDYCFTVVKLIKSFYQHHLIEHYKVRRT